MLTTTNLTGFGAGESSVSYVPALVGEYNIADGQLYVAPFIPLTGSFGMFVKNLFETNPITCQMLNIGSDGVLTANGSLQSFTSDATLGESGNIIDGGALSATSGIITYKSGSNNQTAQGFTVSGSTLSAGAPISLYAGQSAPNNMVAIDSGHALCSYRESGQAYALLTLSNNTVTKVTEASSGIVGIFSNICLVFTNGVYAAIAGAHVSGVVDLVIVDLVSNAVAQVDTSGVFTAYQDNISPSIVSPNTSKIVFAGYRNTTSTSKAFATLIDITGTPTEDSEVEIFADTAYEISSLGSPSIVAIDDEKVLVIAGTSTGDILLAAILDITDDVITQVGDSVDITPTNFYASNVISRGFKVSDRMFAFKVGGNNDMGEIAITVAV